VIARDLAVGQLRETREAQRDLPALPDPRVGLAGSLSALGIFSAALVALTAGSAIGIGYAYSDVVVLLVVQLGAAVAIWRTPWRIVSEAWLVVAIGLQAVFAAALITLTGGSASPYFVLYAPILAFAGWHLRSTLLAPAVGLVVATELWRAYLGYADVSIAPIAVSLPVYVLLAVAARLASGRSTRFHLLNRRDQVRAASTVTALRAFADAGEREDGVERMADIAGGVFDARAGVIAQGDMGGSASHQCPAGEAVHLAVPLVVGSARLGHLWLCRAAPFATSERRLAQILADAMARTMAMALLRGT
jgi:hypothetical protein